MRAPALVENLAASIYKQGEQANQAGDFRAAANHFLRIKQSAPTSKIRAGAEYDAGAALIRLQDWKAAADVLNAFRQTYPEHELQKEATKQIAFVYRQAGELAQSAGEYERVANESTDPALRAEALLAGGRTCMSSRRARIVRSTRTHATSSSSRKPIEAAVETRFKIAEIHKGRGDDALYRKELTEIVRIDAAAAGERTGRTRNLAGALGAGSHRAALSTALSRVKLRQPFEKTLKEKQRGMNVALEAFGKLVNYEVGEVTAAATYYMAEVYADFGRSLLESERPAGLKEAALQKYNDQLEEEAFPFEEKAIKFHEKNLELMASAYHGAWTDKSLARLAILKPGRYAKSEISTGFLGTIDRYEYRKPATRCSDYRRGHQRRSSQCWHSINLPGCKTPVSRSLRPWGRWRSSRARLRRRWRKRPLSPKAPMLPGRRSAKPVSR